MKAEKKPSEIVQEFIDFLEASKTEYEEAKAKCDKYDSIDRHIYTGRISLNLQVIKMSGIGLLRHIRKRGLIEEPVRIQWTGLRQFMILYAAITTRVRSNA